MRSLLKIICIRSAVKDKIKEQEASLDKYKKVNKKKFSMEQKAVIHVEECKINYAIKTLNSMI